MTPSRRTMRNSSIELLESYRAAMMETQDSFQDTEHDPVDSYGEEITRILNKSRAFQSYPTEDRSENLSAKKLADPASTSDSSNDCPRESLQSFLQRKWDFLFWNTKPIESLFVLSSALFVAALWTSAVVSATASWLYFRFLWMLTTMALSVWVDSAELQQLLPLSLQKLVGACYSVLKWVDDFVLCGIRYQGREWNKKEFEVDDGKSAQSSYSYLWALPPPSVRQCDSSFNWEGNERGDWSSETNQHAKAIDFCYNMLRQSAIRQKFSKMRKTAGRRVSKLGPVVSSNEKNGEIIAYTSELNTPRNVAARETTRPPGLTTIHIDTSNREKSKTPKIEDSMGALQLKSPTDAVEVMHHKEQIFFDSNRTIRHVKSDDSIAHKLTEKLILHDDDISLSHDIDHKTGRVKQDAEARSEENAADMNWMDVGAEIGLKLLGSAAVQKAMTSHDTAERIHNMKENFGRTAPEVDSRRSMTTSTSAQPKAVLAPPVHSMWTSATAAAAASAVISPLHSDNGDPSSAEEELRHQEMPLHLQVNGEKRDTSDLDEDDTNRVIRGNSSLTSCSGGIGFSSSASFPKKRPTPRSMQGQSLELASKTSVAPKNHEKLPTIGPGVKIVVPLSPYQPGMKSSHTRHQSSFQMATVVSSKRMFVGNTSRDDGFDTNCLSVTVKLDRSFLRGGEFADLTFRIMDAWGSRYVPKHSKLPIGTCVATRYGIGVLVGWRVEDDCHIVRSLWQRRGLGSVAAYLNRDSIFSMVEAAVGFHVKTIQGNGTVVAVKCDGRGYRYGKFSVKITDDGSKLCGQNIEIDRSEILACPSAQFIPVIEHIREAAMYRLQLFDYKESLEARISGVSSDPLAFEGVVWQNISKWSEMLWKSFLLAIEEDEDFDDGMNEFIATVIKLLDKLDVSNNNVNKDTECSDNHIITAINSTDAAEVEAGENTWVHNIFGIYGDTGETGVVATESIEVEWLPSSDADDEAIRQKSYSRIFNVIKTMMRTIEYTKAACVDEPDLKLALSICHEMLLFARTVIRVQQKNTNPFSIKVWRRALEEIAATFGPAKERIERVWGGIVDRIEQQGNRAKVRILEFVDIILQDDVLLLAMEQGDWGRCLDHVEDAMVSSQIVDEANREHYHKAVHFILNHFANASSGGGVAGARNNEKLTQFAHFIQCLASPKRSILRFFLEETTLNTIERILVRVFDGDPSAARMLTINAQNFHSLRQFRMLKDFTVAGNKFWIPLLDAADAEFAWMVSQMPDGTKDYMVPFSKLLSLCIVEFHKINEGDITNHFLEFLMEEEAAAIIHDLDMKLILALESFSRDVRDTMVILPYYPSIEDDILNLVDEIDIDGFLREAALSLDDPEKLSDFIREKTTIAIERFLDYLPKMSIPVEKRDLADGWVLTCRGEDGGDLTLTDLVVKRENLVCQVLGGDSMFFPMLSSDGGAAGKLKKSTSASSPKQNGKAIAESSILDEIREMILQAKRYNCWNVGVGGIVAPPSDRYVASVLDDLPVSKVLDSGIELWRNLEIDDDELLEIAIKDIAYQIRLNAGKKPERNSSNGESTDEAAIANFLPSITSSFSSAPDLLKKTSSSESLGRRFNPRDDPTVLYLEIKMLTFHLEKFFFRIEKEENRRTIFDPVFEGCGNLLVRNVSIKLRVECLKTQSQGPNSAIPILLLRELDVQLEKVKLEVRETGADWLLNKVVQGFEDSITEVVATNLEDQVREQVDLILDNLNSYFEVNPAIVLGLLGISMDDLAEHVEWV
ncbi:unnamed protein product [Cylindrotheca closterium]|uniref:Uncharacterized protein n=1 Tax=Cylindrotheca closterium TaxID=2856 RepID=A0AAD2CJQ8_9STRA|nr:unnamed protein product [Cylindrotheca closterium]